MRAYSDLILIVEPDPASNAVLSAVAARLGCEHVEADSLESLNEALRSRRPTIAVLAVDRVDTNYLGVLDSLAKHEARPALLLVGSISQKVLASAKRAAEARHLTVLSIDSRPLDAIAIERRLAPLLTIAPPVAPAELQRALAEYEFTLFYQLKLAMVPGAVTIQGVEALVRWHHPRRGLLHPKHFLTAVEDFGLMAQLTDFVMAEALRQAGHWRTNGLNLEVIINLSTKLVDDRGFPERLALLLRENDFPPDQLVLDVTESPSAHDQDLLLDVFTRLRILGVGLSLDNFGTGLSSLTELYRMPFSEVKVDHSLVADMPKEREARVIVAAIVDLAHALRLNVCAEGVETRQMLELVRSAGCDTVQGRLFSDAVPAADIDNIVRTWTSSGPPAVESSSTRQPSQFDGSVTTIRTHRYRGEEGKIPT